MERWHSTSGGWYEAGSVPDGVMAAVLWSQPLSPLGPGGRQGTGCTGTRGVGCCSHAPGGWAVGDGRGTSRPLRRDNPVPAGPRSAFILRQG